MINKIYEKVRNFIKVNYKFLVFFAILIFMFYYEFPYIIYKSGGTIDLGNRVKVEAEYVEEGKLKMSYVTAMKGTPAFVLLSYVLPDWDLMPMEKVAGADSDYDEVLEEGKAYLNEGIDNAIISAFKAAGRGLTITKTINTIMYISGEADTDIVVGDVLLKVDNIETNTLNELKEYINSKNEGDIVKVKVSNNDKEYERYAKVYQSEEDLKIGIAFKTNYEYETEVPVTVKMKDNESGSSGSFMMSLAIYNALTEDDITKGLNIVGTGSIDNEGNILEIGGVKYKALAAEKNEADIFMVPKENYEEAIKVKKNRNLKVKIVEVSTLQDAIDYLNNNY